METVTGTMWQEGGWILWTLIWHGHMVLLEPPPSLDARAVFDRWQPHDTPALGFLFFWHSRHDQERTSPGTVFCRLCKPSRKAGEVALSFSLTGPRKDSNLAAAAIVGCIRAGASAPEDLYQVRGDSLCFQEVFAGAGVMTKGWLAAGVRCLDPVEVFKRQGYRAFFDVTLPEVQKRLLRQVREGPANVWRLAAPRTSFCDWGLQNGGTRSFQFPAGGKDGAPLTDSEIEGNLLSKVEAELFLAGLETGAFPVAESTARSGRYPKMWDLPWWQAILARPDVQWVEFPMCAFGLGPEGEDGFYHHRTRLVFPRCEPLADALARRCPGVGAAHCHVPLKGSRLGSSVTRCTEAGVYSKDFVAEVARVLTTVLSAGGGQTGKATPQADLSCKAGGSVCAGLLGGRPGWLDEIADDDQVDFTVVGAYALCGGQDTRAGSLERCDGGLRDSGLCSGFARVAKRCGAQRDVGSLEDGTQDEIAAVGNDLATKAGGEGNGESDGDGQTCARATNFGDEGNHAYEQTTHEGDQSYEQETQVGNEVARFTSRRLTRATRAARSTSMEYTRNSRAARFTSRRLTRATRAARSTSMERTRNRSSRGSRFGATTATSSNIKSRFGARVCPWHVAPITRHQLIAPPMTGHSGLPGPTSRRSTLARLVIPRLGSVCVSVVTVCWMRPARLNRQREACGRSGRRTATTTWLEFRMRIWTPCCTQIC